MFCTRLNTHTHKKIPMKKKVSAKKKCFQSASYMKKYIIQRVTIHVRKFIFSCIELSEINFFHGWNSFFRTIQKMSGSFLFSVWTQRKKKAGMSRVKSKYNFEKFLLFQRKKIISLCSTSEKKSLVFSYSARRYKNKLKNFTCENSIFRRKQISTVKNSFFFNWLDK